MAWNVFKKNNASIKDAEVSAPKKSATSGVVKDAPATGAVSRKKMGTFPVAAYALLIRPLVTEKSLEAARHDVYAFQVKKDATKIEIQKAFSNLYGVMPLSVRTMNRQGKVVRFGRREGRRSDWKKALITVPKGTTIDIA